MLVALAIQFSPISPMHALVWSAVINGVVAVPLMVVILITAARKSVMGDFVENKVILALGKGAHDQTLRSLAVRPAASYPFIHGRLHTLPNGLLLADSYHCSRYNTNTGRLTTAMFHDVFTGIRRALG